MEVHVNPPHKIVNKKMAAKKAAKKQNGRQKLN